MKNRLLNNWTLWRIIRAVLSVVFITNGIFKGDYILLAGGVFLLIHALVNTCAACNTGNCEVPQK
jgi:hypothetical protein